MDYPFPDDEFDRAAQTGGHRGVHRTPRSTWEKLWPFLAAIVVFPLLAIGAVNLMSQDRLPEPVPAATPSASASQTSDASASPSEMAVTPVQTPTAPAVPPSPILTTPVGIYNAAGIQGIAAAAQAEISAEGYVDVSVGNLAENRPEASVVYYVGETLAVTAADIAGILEIPAVTADDGFLAERGLPTAGVVVVIVTDFR